jgi:comEA protein
MLDKFSQKAGFTPTEGRVVFFLVASFLVGLGIKIVKERSAGAERFDYAVSDSTFTALSRQADADTAAREADGGEPEVATEGSPDPAVHLVDINTALKSEFAELPGIGEVMAERIVRYRKEHGRFASVDDLIHVSGIGKKKLDRIRPYCTLKQ